MLLFTISCWFYTFIKIVSTTSFWFTSFITIIFTTSCSSSTVRFCPCTVVCTASRLADWATSERRLVRVVDSWDREG